MNDPTSIGRWIMLGGLGLLIVGAIIWLSGRIGLPLGRLPGDIRIERDGFSCFVPLASSLIISLLLSLLLNLFLRRLK